MKIKLEIIVTVDILLGLVLAYIYGQHIENVSFVGFIAAATLIAILATGMLMWVEYYGMKLIKRIYRNYVMRKGE